MTSSCMLETLAPTRVANHSLAFVIENLPFNPWNCEYAMPHDIYGTFLLFSHCITKLKKEYLEIGTFGLKRSCQITSQKSHIGTNFSDKIRWDNIKLYLKSHCKQITLAKRVVYDYKVWIYTVHWLNVQQSWDEKEIHINLDKIIQYKTGHTRKMFTQYWRSSKWRYRVLENIRTLPCT